MGKASLPKTPINDTLDANRDRKKQFGRERAAFSRVPFYSTSIGSGMNSNANSSVTSVEGLSTAGGTMMGPIAFYPQSQTISNGTINVSSQNAYSSRVVINGQGSASDDLEVILGASHAGQIVFFEPVTMGQTITLQDFAKTATAWATGTSYIIGDVRLSGSRRYTCYVAHTSSSSTQPISGSDWSDKWHRNNIHIPGATEKVVQANEIILLQYDQSSNITWTVVSGGGSGGSSGAGLGDDNVWTGINTFQGTATSINSPTINLGDAGTDIINMIARCDSIGTNTWAGTNTFNSGVFFNSAVTFTGTPINFNSNQINLGDNNATDNVFVLATMKMFGDFNANTYDMYNIDRLKFGTTAGSGSALAATDTGIEAVYSGGNSYGMKSVVPANNVYQMFIGSSEKVTIATSVIVLNNPVTIGGALAMSNNKITGLATPTATTDAATKAYVDAGGGGSGWNGNATSDLDMNTNNIIDVTSITTGSISTSSITATNSLQSNGTTVLGNQSSDSVIIGGTINGNVVMADNLTIQDDLQVYDDVTLGSSITDDIDINGRVEIGNSYTAYIQSPPALSVGYVTIKVNGSTRNILCF